MRDFKQNIDALKQFGGGIMSPSDIFVPVAGGKTNVNSPKGSEATPTIAGRSSLPQNISLFGVIMGEMAQVQPGFELEMLRVCEFLAKYNGDVSYAVDNIRQLGNTKYSIKFDDTVKDDQAKKMLKVLNIQSRWLYSGAIRSLIGDLFAQIYITGAISAEMIPDKTLSYIQNVSLVNPYTIRFMYNPETYGYDSYQTLNNFMGIMLPRTQAGDASQMGLHRLNPVTYRYIAHSRFNDNPFAIPPIISSFEGIEIEKDMLNNMRHIVRKMGVFGFLSVMLTAPMRTQGETEVKYFARCTDYLNKVRPEVERGYATGVALGFKGFQEWKVEGGNTNLAGAKEIFQLVSEIKMAGLKQDPLMLGRNFNVAETMAKVIMSKLTTQIASYQAIVAVFLEDLFKMQLLLNGFKVDRVMVEFEPPMIGDKLRAEQAREKKIVNTLMERDAGIISQQDTANALGHEEAHAEKDVDYSVPSAADLAKKTVGKTNPSKDPVVVNDSVNPGATNYSIEYLESRLTRGIAPFDYTSCCGAERTVHSHSFAKDNKDAQKIVAIAAAYAASASSTYRKAVDKVTLDVATELSAMSGNATLQQITDKVFYVLYNNFSESYTTQQEAVVRKYVKQAYNFFRQDQGAFGGVTTITKADGATVPIPEAKFNLIDAKALDYFKGVDQLYLGRFITDADTKAAITDFIKEKYLAHALPTEDNGSVMESFQNHFLKMLGLEDWKIDRIVNTSVNKMRNYAAIAYMYETGVAKFKVVGIPSPTQCKYCAAMQGYEFSVATAYDKTKKAVQGSAETLSQDAPFITSLFKGDDGIARIQQLTGEELQAQGLIGAPPFHPNCVDMVVAVL